MADIKQLIADAMTTWRSGVMRPRSGVYATVRDGRLCGCLMTAAAACGNPELVERMRADEDDEVAIECVLLTVERRYGVGQSERAALIDGFDGWNTTSNDRSIYTEAREVARAVGVLENRYGGLSPEELAAVQLPWESPAATGAST